MAFKTQGEVAKLARANGYKQVPGVYSQIIGDDFYLAGPPASPRSQAPTPVLNVEQADFAAALQSASVAKLDAFLSKYPASSLADVVRRERARLKQAPGQPTTPSPTASATVATSIAARPPGDAFFKKAGGRSGIHAVVAFGIGTCNTPS
jgi:hypothetical protein